MNRLRAHIEAKRFPAVDGEERLVLDGLAIDIPAGEFVCITGPSGCGKTTLLNILAGLDTDYRGSVTLPSAAAGVRPTRVGYVFQTPRLLPWKTVLENIRFVLPTEERDGVLVGELLREVGLWDFRHEHPARLSLGMQRRAALVRAFAVRPDVMLLDEPFVSLDEVNAQGLRRLLVRLWRERPTTVVFVTHDLREAVVLADRLIVLTARPARLSEETRLEPDRAERSEAVADELRREIVRRHSDIFVSSEPDAGGSGTMTGPPRSPS